MERIKSCPCCGHPLAEGDYVPGLRLTPYEALTFRIISRQSPGGLSASDLADLIYADREDGGPDNAAITVRVRICQLNKKLKPHQLRIRGWGGYRLEQIP